MRVPEEPCLGVLGVGRFGITPTAPACLSKLKDISKMWP